MRRYNAEYERLSIKKIYYFLVNVIHCDTLMWTEGFPPHKGVNDETLDSRDTCLEMERPEEG